MRPFLRTKRIAGNGKRCLTQKLVHAYANGIVVLAEGLHMFRLGAIATDGMMIPIRKFVLHEKNFGWMDVWELNPEGLGSLWLITSTTCGGEPFWLKTSIIGVGGPCPF
jgi:hypothetical protein